MQGFSQSSPSDFIMIAIGVKRLWIEMKTTRQHPTFTFGKCEEMSSGKLNKIIFQLFIEVNLLTTRKDAPDGLITLKSRVPYFEIFRQ